MLPPAELAQWIAATQEALEVKGPPNQNHLHEHEGAGYKENTQDGSKVITLAEELRRMVKRLIGRSLPSHITQTQGRSCPLSFQIVMNPVRWLQVNQDERLWREYRPRWTLGLIWNVSMIHCYQVQSFSHYTGGVGSALVWEAWPPEHPYFRRLPKCLIHHLSSNKRCK